MKRIFLLIFSLVLAFQVMAQSTEKIYFLLNESKVVDTDIYKKNYPVVRNWWMEATKGISYNLSAHTSETGRTYGMVFVRGEGNLGKYVGLRAALSDKAAMEIKAVTDENTSNRMQAIARSIWVQVPQASVIEPNFKMENYDFRKIHIFTVPFDKVSEYESLIQQSNALDKSLGFSYNYILYKAVDGYANNTYMLILPDKSRLDYYTHQTERNAKRKGNSQLASLNKRMGQLRNIVRIDYLSRVGIN